MANKRIINIVILLVTVSIALVGVFGYIAASVEIGSRKQCIGTIISESDGIAIVRYSVGDTSFEYETSDFNIGTKTGEEIKVAYNEDDPSDVVTVGDKKSKNLILIATAIVITIVRAIAGIVFFASYSKVRYISGEISEVVQVLTDNNKYYAIAKGIHPVGRMVVEAVSDTFDKEKCDEIEIGSIVTIKIGKKKENNTFEIFEQSI